MRDGRTRVSGPGGFRQPRLKVKCGDLGGRNHRGEPCGCRELFKRGKPIARGAAVDLKARCRFHGGMLAGPTTQAGRERANKAGAETLKRLWARRREQQGAA